jgi:hypothetical protein
MAIRTDDLDPLPRHDATMGRSGRPCRGPRDGPITAANAIIEDWEQVEGIIVDQRDKSMRKGRLVGDCMEDPSHVQIFFRFLALKDIEPLLPQWQDAARNKEAPGMLEIAMSRFVGWLGLWVMMMVLSLPSRKMYWQQSSAYSCSMFSEWGSHRYFEELLSIFFLPEYKPDHQRYVHNDPLQSVRKWFDGLAEVWRAAYEAGSILVVEETIIFWTGEGLI